MRPISFSLVLLTACNSFLAHEEDLKHIAHDVVDEEIDDAVQLFKDKKEKNTGEKNG